MHAEHAEHPCAWSDERLLAAVREETSRASGPGGQHANKTASGVRLVWREDPTIHAQAGEERDRQVNRRRALRRLRLQLALHRRGGSDPSWLAPHRQGRRLRVSSTARDLHLVAACLLDALEAAAGSLVDAATACAISSSTLVKTLAVDKALWQAAQDCRRRHGLSTLRSP